MTKNSRRLFLTFVTIAIGLSASASFAQEQDALLPTIPDPLKALVNEGAQIRFLGRDEGIEGWIVINGGVE